MKKKFYITTSIVYTNASPHIGFVFELIQADVIARYHRILGEDVFFLTGTDEHGAKIARKAKQEEKTPQIFCDEIVKKYKELTKKLNISNNDFIRTTDRDRHWPGVYKFWEKMKKNGDIYEKKYQGLYCVGCEAFIKEKDLINGNCQFHHKVPEKVSEKNYFFRLSKYSNQIKKNIEDNVIKIIPESRKNEMLAFIDNGLEDISFSRPKEKVEEWGIPVHGDDSQLIYVWGDALVNYISAIGYGKKEDNFLDFWPADIHCIGKDIQKFHILIWQGILLSAGLSLPKNIFVHGFINVDGKKMSKSLGNVVDPFELVEKYGTDAVRYFLLREISPTEDGDFTYQKFEQRYNSDLASGLGNLVARTLSMSKKIDLEFKFLEINKIKNSEAKTKINQVIKSCNKLLDEFKFNEALVVIWELISFCDKYIEKERPWEKSEKQEQVIRDLIFIINEIAKLIEPFLPETSEKILEQLQTKKSEPLFPRL